MRTRSYPTDLTDAQWALVAPHIPAAKSGGRPRTTDVRAVFDAIVYPRSSPDIRQASLHGSVSSRARASAAVRVAEPPVQAASKTPSTMAVRRMW